MDDWKDDNDNFSGLAPMSEAGEHVERVSYAKALSTLLRQKDEALALCDLYSDVMGEPVELEDFNLTTSQSIQHFSTVAHIFATEDVSEPEDYLKTLPIKPIEDRLEEPAKSITFSGIRKKSDRTTTDSDFTDNIPTFDSKEIQKAVFHVTANYLNGKTTTLRLGKKNDGVVISDLSIDGEEDSESLRNFLDTLAEPALREENEPSEARHDNAAEAPKHTIRFKQLAEDYLPKRLKNLSRKQNQNKAISAVELFDEYFSNDPWVHEVSREMAEELLNVLMRLPKHRKSRSASKNLSLSEMLEIEWNDTLEGQGLTNYTSEWHQLFKYALERQYCTINPFENVKPLTKRRKKSEEAVDKDNRLFTEQELTKIFSASIFTEKASRSYYFWVPVICIYTGARVNEIAQLDIDDVYKKDGIWCIDINDRGESKSVKTQASNRIVPVHSDLIDIGFIRYVQTIKEACSDPKNARYRTNKLWWDIYQVGNDYARACQKGLEQAFRDVGFERKGAKFHGFRHSVTAMLKYEGVDESTYGTILGHDSSNRTGGVYGGAYKVKTLQKALEKIKPLNQSVIEKLSPYRLPRTLLPENDWKRFDRKKYLVDLTKEVTEKHLLKKIDSWN